MYKMLDITLTNYTKHTLTNYTEQSPS